MHYFYTRPMRTAYALLVIVLWQISFARLLHWSAITLLRPHLTVINNRIHNTIAFSRFYLSFMHSVNRICILSLTDAIYAACSSINLILKFDSILCESNVQMLMSLSVCHHTVKRTKNDERHIGPLAKVHCNFPICIDAFEIETPTAFLFIHSVHRIPLTLLLTIRGLIHFWRSPFSHFSCAIYRFISLSFVIFSIFLSFSFLKTVYVKWLRKLYKNVQLESNSDAHMWQRCIVYSKWEMQFCHGHLNITNTKHVAWGQTIAQEEKHVYMLSMHQKPFGFRFAAHTNLCSQWQKKKEERNCCLHKSKKMAPEIQRDRELKPYSKRNEVENLKIRIVSHWMQQCACVNLARAQTKVLTLKILSKRFPPWFFQFCFHYSFSHFLCLLFSLLLISSNGTNSACCAIEAIEIVVLKHTDWMWVLCYKSAQLRSLHFIQLGMFGVYFARTHRIQLPCDSNQSRNLISL